LAVVLDWDSSAMLIKVEFASFAVDPEKNTPLIILKEISGARALPIPIGPLEASAIAIETLKVKPEKPLTIDLAKSILEVLGGRIARVIIHQGSETSLMARIEIEAQGTVTATDCRPCDAIALALRCRAPIFVRDGVFEKFASGGNLSETDKLRSHIAALDTLDFGDFYLE
jgi:bifunctional DNase/RNase